MLDVMRLGIIIIGSSTIFLGFLSNRNRNSFDSLINITAFLLTIHAADTLPSRLELPRESFMGTAAPYGMVYGPLLYFGLKAISKKKIGIRRIILHMFPFVVVFFLYCLLLIFPIGKTNFLADYLDVLYTAIGFSFFGYALWGFFYRGNISKDHQEELKVLHFANAILFVTAIFFASVQFTMDSKKPSHDYPLLFTNGIMLLSTLILFIYHSSGLKNDKGRKKTLKDPVSIPVGVKGARYEKAALSADLLDQYQQKFLELVEENKLYLNPELSLVTIATTMKVPTNHLSQMINLRFGKNFKQVVNGYRILHACSLLEQTRGTVKLEKIAFASGFNSRVSFNRNFKIEKGCSPTEYLSMSVGKFEG